MFEYYICTLGIRFMSFPGTIPALYTRHDISDSSTYKMVHQLQLFPAMPFSCNSKAPLQFSLVCRLPALFIENTNPLAIEAGLQYRIQAHKSIHAK